MTEPLLNVDGVGKGTRVGLLCPNRPEWLPLAFGALRLGAIMVPFSTLWKREEIAYGLAHGDVQVLLTRAGFLKHDYLADLTDLERQLPGLRERHDQHEYKRKEHCVLVGPGERRPDREHSRHHTTMREWLEAPASANR